MLAAFGYDAARLVGAHDPVAQSRSVGAGAGHRSLRSMGPEADVHREPSPLAASDSGTSQESGGAAPSPGDGRWLTKDAMRTHCRQLPRQA